MFYSFTRLCAIWESVRHCCVSCSVHFFVKCKIIFFPQRLLCFASQTHSHGNKRISPAADLKPWQTKQFSGWCKRFGFSTWACNADTWGPQFIWGRGKHKDFALLFIPGILLTLKLALCICMLVTSTECTVHRWDFIQMKQRKASCHILVEFWSQNHVCFWCNINLLLLWWCYQQEQTKYMLQTCCNNELIVLIIITIK